MLKLLGNLCNFFAALLIASSVFAQEPVTEKQSTTAEVDAKKETAAPVKKSRSC